MLPALCLAAALLANAHADPVEPPIHVGLEGRLFLSHGTNPHPGALGVGRENIGMFLAVPARFHRLEARLSLGGIFYMQAAPSDGGAWNSSYRTGGIELDELFVKVPFHPLGFRSSLTAGWFRWKTNPDAVMAGEYLARYSAYPTFPVRHAMPWDPLDSLAVSVSGIRLSVASPTGRWRHSALVLADSGGPGTDISLAYGLDAYPIRGLEVGLATEAYRFRSAFGNQVSTVVSRDTNGGSWIPVDTAGRNGFDTVTFTRRALLLSLRAALDLKEMIAGTENPGRAWRIFAEAALLGWRNQPKLYDSRRDRLALMAGVHLPSFGLLDIFCLQWEFLPSAWELYPMTFFRRLPSPSPVEDQEIRVSRFHLVVSKQVRSWIGVQAWLSNQIDAPPDSLGSYGPNRYSSSHPIYELRLVGRF